MSGGKKANNRNFREASPVQDISGADADVSQNAGFTQSNRLTRLVAQETCIAFRLLESFELYTYSGCVTDELYFKISIAKFLSRLKFCVKMLGRIITFAEVAHFQ